MSKNLYLVPTPIGNLADMTYRGVEVLKSVAVILAEDTRLSGKLLKHFGITTPQKPFHEHNQTEVLPDILKLLLKVDVALISDAGTPGISDPGYGLVTAAIERDVNVIALPGATAFVPALVASGLPNHQFTFIGFLPKKPTQRDTILAQYQNRAETLILYESPFRLVDTLKAIKTNIGNRQICVVREISKVFESYYRLTVEEAIEYFSKIKIHGEIVILVSGPEQSNMKWTEADLIAGLKQEISNGVGLSQAAKTLAQLSGVPKGKIYQLGLNEIKNSNE